MRTVEVTDELQEYLDGLVPRRDTVLARIEEEAHRDNVPIVDPHEGQLLYLLVKMAGARRILFVRAATCASTRSGHDNTPSVEKWCSPIHAEWSPTSSA